LKADNKTSICKPVVPGIPRSQTRELVPGQDVRSSAAARFIENRGIDEAVGAVSVHGVCGIFGLVFAGIFLGGYPQFADNIPSITLTGQLVGVVVIFLLGCVPGFVFAWIFRAMGILRANDGVQEVGMDVEIEAMAYPEDIKSV
jgi:ammonia channel protein AmtB